MDNKTVFLFSPTLHDAFRPGVRCSMPKLKRSVLSTLPVLSWLPRYSVRDNGLGDLISGISVGIMHLPQGMAYALLASVPPVFGLYTSFYPVLVYCILGTSRHISIGTFAVISIMIGSVTERLAPDSDFTFLNGTNGTAVLDVTARDAYRVQIAASTTVLSGLFQVLLGMVRFGFVVTYLSEPLVRGYTTGAATHVVVSQLKYIFGIHPARFSGPLSQVYILIDICRHLPETNIGALVVSLVALVVLIVVKELNSCYEKKLPLPIPIELIVIVAATLISYYGNLNSQYDVAVVGEIPRGLKSPSLPDVSLWGTVVGDAFAVAIVGYAINISLGKTFGLKHGYKVDSNQELVALGLSNTVGGFFQCYSVTSSMSRSLIQESTGGRTQVAGVVSSVIVLITVLQLGTLFGELPKAVLSCIVFVNLKGMFKQYLDIPALWKSNTVDLLVWLVTLVCTILLNLDLGLAASIAFSLLTVIFRTQLPRYSILGQVPGTELYLDTDTYEEIPGITIFRSSTTVYYTNAELYLDALQKKVVSKPQFTPEQSNIRSLCQSKVNWAYEQQWTGLDLGSETGSHGDDAITQTSSTVGEEKRGRSSKTHTIILDLSTASFVDTVTVMMLNNIFRDYREIDIDIYLAGCQVCVVEQLSRASFFSESIPKSRLFTTVHDAVLHSLRLQGASDVPIYECALVSRPSPQGHLAGGGTVLQNQLHSYDYINELILILRSDIISFSTRTWPVLPRCNQHGSHWSQIINNGY
uniref:Solute carrier family 26 member 6, like 2 n=1 Tax=Oncorhynchus mykiss TaxID=8022 RepID=A0A8K9XGK5_ONCMY